MTNSYYACIYILHFILHAYVKLYTLVHVWSDAMRVFAFAHACHTCGLFKLCMICRMPRQMLNFTEVDRGLRLMHVQSK